MGSKKSRVLRIGNEEIIIGKNCLVRKIKARKIFVESNYGGQKQHGIGKRQIYHSIFDEKCIVIFEINFKINFIFQNFMIFLPWN